MYAILRIGKFGTLNVTVNLARHELDLEGAAPGGSGSSGVEEKLWKKHWNACVPGKVKIFAWRGCLDSLPTRTKLSRRRIPVEEACLFCHGTIETVEHVLRD